MKRFLPYLLPFIVGGFLSFLITKQFYKEKIKIPPEITNKPSSTLLNKYAIQNLNNYPVTTSELKIKDIIHEDNDYTAYLFTYQTVNKTMSGQINVPKKAIKNPAPAIIMIRGWFPQHSFETGSGTKNSSKFFAQNGFVTIAPDFFGFGESDPEPKDSWEARFIKPINILDLIASVKQFPVVKNQESTELITINPEQLGIWGHSNGGQIAISILEANKESIPTTLWAPVTAPFPYSILFFSRDTDDEGKELRKWLSIFEDDYDVFNYTITQHLSKLTAPLQIQHGTADEDAPITWSDTFSGLIQRENNFRKTKRKEMDKAKELEDATKSAIVVNESLVDPLLEKIDFTYHRYPGADHNLKQVYSKALKRDLAFFKKYLLN